MVLSGSKLKKVEAIGGGGGNRVRLYFSWTKNYVRNTEGGESA